MTPFFITKEKTMNVHNTGLHVQGQILLGIILSLGVVSIPMIGVMFLIWWEKQLNKLSQ